MRTLDLVNLTALMSLTSGRSETVVGLIDGPVLMNHPDLASENIREISGPWHGACAQPESIACMHGTFIAGILSAKRNTAAPAICPNCTLLLRPIFAETDAVNGQLPSASPVELAAAINDCINAGARVINMSVALTEMSSRGEHELEDALDYAIKRGVLVVAAAGNQATIGSSIITRHPWVIPVVGCDLSGRPINESNLGASIGRSGLSAPGQAVTSLNSDGETITSGGTSIAAPFVTGTIALLWSQFPTASTAQIKLAVTNVNGRRRSIVPPLLDAEAAYQILKQAGLE